MSVEIYFAVAAVETERVVAGIVEITAVFDDFQDVVVDGKTGGAVAVYLGAGDVFQEFFAFEQILFQFIVVDGTAEVVVVSVGSDFVAAMPHLLNQVR